MALYGLCLYRYWSNESCVIIISQYNEHGIRFADCFYCADENLLSSLINGFTLENWQCSIYEQEIASYWLWIIMCFMVAYWYALRGFVFVNSYKWFHVTINILAIVDACEIQYKYEANTGGSVYFISLMLDVKWKKMCR